MTDQPEPTPVELRLFQAQQRFGHTLMTMTGAIRNGRLQVDMGQILGEMAFMREWLTMLCEHYCATSAIAPEDMYEALIARLDAKVAELSSLKVAVAAPVIRGKWGV